jgi:hypothetical protein
MAHSIYDKPTKQLMQEFSGGCLKPGQIFEKKQAVDWFAKHYPNIKPTTVQMHVEGMAINSGARKHHHNIKPNSGHNLFFKTAPGKFRLWEPTTDPQPIYREQISADVDNVTDDISEDDQSETNGGSQEFAFERDLRNYLAKNLNSLEKGLTLFHDEEFSGIEFPVGGRFIDILATDSQSNYVIIELKVSRGYDRVVGQILRYMAWVKKTLRLITTCAESSSQAMFQKI